ncbi:MAG TPA: hypothetical protein VLZ75_05580 [Chitinophagales bacterium]|nr:hypothetical protein [Chitinophagales bacterium]
MDIQELEKKEPVRKRHGFVTFWLVYILMNGLSTLLAYTIFREEIQKILKIEISDEVAYYLMGLGVMNAISVILLLNWKKIGFHGLVISNIVNMYVSNLMGSGVESTFFGLMQIAILYMVLKMKKNEKSTWDWLT